MDFQKILVPTDGSPVTDAAVDEGLKLAALSKGRVTALYVLDQSAGSKEAVCLAETGKAAIDGISRKGKDIGVDVEGIMIKGVPSKVILDESAKYDVIVMGTLGRTGISKLLAGSVAETVIKRSGCPVIVVRSPEVDKK